MKVELEQAIEETKEKIISEYEKTLDEDVKIKNITVSSEVLNENEAYVKVIFECNENIALLR